MDKKLWIIGLVVMGCSGQTPKEPPPAASSSEVASVQTAHGEVHPVRARFISRMRKLGDKPLNSSHLDHCRIEPGEVSAIKVGRTSHKVRNPDNAPEPWVVPYLEKFKGKRRADVPPYVIENLEDEKIGYLEPLFMEPICLRCHGTQVSPTLEDAIEERYPKDQATGFENGEFRGFIWAIYAK